MSNEPFELFSQPWCDFAINLWHEEIAPILIEPETFNYTTEVGCVDGDQVCQWKADHGKLLWWNSAKGVDDEDVDFILYATKANWEKVATGKLDPVSAVAAKRIQLRKGPMQVVLKQAEPFKKWLQTFGRVPTSW